MSTLAAFLAALVLVAGSASARQPNASETQHLLARNSAFEKAKSLGQWDECAAICQEMISYMEGRGISQAFVLTMADQLGLCRSNQGRYKEALAIYQHILREAPKIRPSNEQSNMNLQIYNAFTGAGRALSHQGEHQESFKYFEQAIEFARTTGMTKKVAEGQTDLAFAFNLSGRRQDAIELLRQAIPVLQQTASKAPKGSHDRTSYANALRAMGTAYDGLGRYDLGDPYHRAALDVLVKSLGWKHNFTADMAEGLANSWLMQGRHAEAEPLLRTVVSIYEGTIGRRTPYAAITLNNLARLLAFNGRYQEGLAMGSEVLDIKRQFFDADSPEIAVSMLNLSSIHIAGNQYQQAKPLVEGALAIYVDKYGEADRSVAECMQALSAIHSMLGSYEEALEYSDRAQAIHQQQPLSPHWTARLHTTRAAILQQLNRPEEAIEEMEKGLALLDFERAYASGSERERAVVLEHNAIFYDMAVLLRAKTNDVEGIFEITESIKARSFLDELQTRSVDLTAGLSDARRRELQQRETELRRRLSQAEAKLDALPPARSNASEQEPARRREAVQGVFAARDALYQHLMDVKNSSATYRDLITNQTQTTQVADVQRQLDPGDLVLSYTSASEHSYVIVIRPEGADFAELMVDETTAAQLGIEAGSLTREKLSQVLLADDEGVLPFISSVNQPPEGFDDKLHALWRLLVPEPVRAGLVGGDVKQLTILPAGSLSLLPFEALVVSQTDAGPEYFLDVGPPIVYAPSASVLLNLAGRTTSAPRAAEPVLALGDPAYASSQPSEQDEVGRQIGNAGAANQFRSNLSRLPFSGSEASWVKQHFDKAGLPTLKLTGAEATEGALRRLITGREIVHLACHGMADQTYGNLFGALALAPGRRGDPTDDGFLSLSEIYSLDLIGCELAILSACETNYGPQQTGEGVWALSRGFLVAGSRRVIASNWVVDDQAGATLVSYFAEYLTSDKADDARRGYAAALHKAKRAVRKQDRWAHPFYWSSLVLIGPR